tara:strand:+ start:1113 stop:1439 length:327 start_codon:yes stop_codon:yes gene_type:complete
MVRFFAGKLWMIFFFLFLIVFESSRGVLFFRSIKVAEVRNYSIDKERDIYNTFDSEDQNDQGIPVDPFDLMNRLKQAGAMNDATTPSDALDEALNAFDESEYKIVPIK